MAFPALQEAWHPNFSLTSPFAPYPRELHRLSAARFALAVVDGQHDKALEQLGQEISFYIRNLEGSYSLFSKMLGIRNLRYCYGLLSQYMRCKPEAARKRLAQINILLAPLPNAAISLRSAIFNEQRNGTLGWALKSCGHPFTNSSTWLEQLATRLILPHVTANELAVMFSPWILAEEASGHDYRQKISWKIQSTARAHYDHFLKFLKWRNPVGHIINLVAFPDYSKYFLKRDDLLALRHLLTIQADLLQQGKSDGATVISMLEAAGSGFEHPYFGTQALWDEQQKRLFFPVSGGKLFVRDAKPVAIQL